MFDLVKQMEKIAFILTSSSTYSLVEVGGASWKALWGSNTMSEWVAWAGKRVCLVFENLEKFSKYCEKGLVMVSIDLFWGSIGGSDSASHLESKV